MRPLLVGQAPSRDTDGGAPFTGRSGRRLAGLLGVDDLGEVVDVANLLGRWPGKRGKGDRFPAGEARMAARALLAGERGRDRMVLAGLAVAAAFGLPALPLSVARRDAMSFLVVPHPSGVCRWWNEAANVEAARTRLREFVSCAG